MDSLNVFEIIPIEFSKERKILHIYKRIKVEELSKERILDIYFNLNFKNSPSVLDLPTAFIIQYRTKPAIVISKENGRLYSFPNKWDLAEVQHQASLVMRVLSRTNFIEDHKRQSIRRRRK